MTSTLSTRKALFLESLERNMGVVSIAAEKCNIDRDTHYKWMKSDMKYKIKVEALRDKMIDLSESKLYQFINGFEIEEEKLYFDNDNKPQVIKVKKKILPEPSMIKFHLETIGKNRGYVKRNELTGLEGLPLNPPDDDIDYSQLPDEVLEAISKARKKKL